MTVSHVDFQAKLSLLQPLASRYTTTAPLLFILTYLNRDGSREVQGVRIHPGPPFCPYSEDNQLCKSFTFFNSEGCTPPWADVVPLISNFQDIPHEVH